MKDMRFTRIFPLTVLSVLILAGCGMSYEETKRLRQEQQQQAFREDSAALSSSTGEFHVTDMKSAMPREGLSVT